MSQRFFQGAGLIVTDRPIGTCPYEVVETEHAAALSRLIFELKAQYANKIDFLNKYGFYPSLGKAANRYLKTGNDEAELLAAVREAAARFWIR